LNECTIRSFLPAIVYTPRRNATKNFITTLEVYCSLDSWRFERVNWLFLSVVWWS